MDILKRFIAVFLLAGLCGSASAQSVTSNWFQEAMLLHQIRKDYAQFCRSIGVSRAQPLVASADTDYGSLHPGIKARVDKIARARSTGVNSAPSNSTPQPHRSFNDMHGSDTTGSNPSPSTSSSIEVDQIRAKVIAEWHFVEAFVLGEDNQVQEDAVLNTTNPVLSDDFPDSFTYLSDIAGEVGGTGTVAARQTSGVLDALAGDIPEAEIIQGIVDWAIQRAKEELLQAFLQGWLDDLERDPVLKIAFPNTLSLLSSSDLSTVFSQGDTWKAAFKQDLDALPANLPAIVKAILDQLPRKLNPAAEREIVGVVNVSSQLYVQLDRNHNNYRDAILLISRSIMQEPDTLAYSERAMIGTKVLMDAVTIVQEGKPSVISPQAILNLGATELCDFWNLLYLRDKAELQRALNISQPDSLYAQVSRELKKVQLILAKTADILENVQEIMAVKSASSGNTGTIQKTTASDSAKKAMSFGEAQAYYELIFELLNNALDLASLVDVPTGDLPRVLDDVVEPLGEDIMNIAHGVSTRQYGEVINGSISLLQILSNQVVRDPKLRDALNDATSLLQVASDFRNQLRSATGSGAQLHKSVSDLLTDWLKAHEKTLDADLKALVQAALARVNAFTETDLEAVKAFLRAELKKLEKDLQDYIDGLDLGQGIDELAAFFNKYGTLMVNILTASSSDEVKEALQEAAAPTGSYMVKQTSTSSITLCFFPGLAAGHEFASPNRDVVAAGADTLGHRGGKYLGATLPIGIEVAFGLKSRVLGAVGIFGQVADLGAVLSFRLQQPGDSVQVASDLRFRNVLAPGVGVVLHAAKIPIALGGRLSYSPQLRSISDQNAGYGLNMLQVGGFVAVDLTVFQLFASRRKIPSASKTYGDR